ncbi:RNA-directed DNA polymerase, eukaryota [Tanacetum coccineum]
MARDLWKLCNDYGVIVDAFILYKKSKTSKRFAFVHFIKVDNIDRLFVNLCTIWIGCFHLHANIARFLREHKPSAPSFPSKANKRKLSDDSCISDKYFSLSIMGKVKDITSLPNLYVILEKEGFQNLSLAYLGGLWVLIETVSSSSKEKLLIVHVLGLPLKVWTRYTFAKAASKWGDLVEWEDLAEKSLFCKRLCVKTKLSEIIVECFKVIVECLVYWVHAKEMEAWDPFICNDSYESKSSDDEDDAEDDNS